MMVLKNCTGRRRLSVIRARFAAFAMFIATSPFPSLLTAQGGAARPGRPEAAAARAPRFDSSAAVAFALRTPLRIRIVTERSRLSLAPDHSPRSSHIWLGLLIGAAAGGAIGYHAGLIHLHQCTGEACDKPLSLDPVVDAGRGIFIGGAIGGGLGALWRLLP
jgi:hypothetical protein